MDHRKGKDPTPQGRNTEFELNEHSTKPADTESYKYENSAPGPDLRKDGTYFFGYKGERQPKERGE